jgi:hypothetical protein
MDEVALKQVFLRVFRFSLLINVPKLFHTHVPTPHDVCDSPDQAAHYHTLGPNLRASSLTRQKVRLGVKVVLVVCDGNTIVQYYRTIQCASTSVSMTSDCRLRVKVETICFNHTQRSTYYSGYNHFGNIRCFEHLQG